MADNTADRDWIDCNALRADPRTSGDGSGEQSAHGVISAFAGAKDDAHAWAPAGLCLIEPDGSVTEIPLEPAFANVGPKAGSATKKAEKDKDARLKAEAAAKREAEEQAKREAEAKAKREAEEKAEREAQKKAQEKAKQEAEKRAREAAEEEARRAAEVKAKKEAEEKARLKAEAEAAEKAGREAEEKARLEAKEKARIAAEAKAKKEAEEKAKREAEERARKEAEEKARREAEEKDKREAEAKAKREAEAKAKREAEAEAKREAEARERAEKEAAAKAKAEEKERKKAEAAAAAAAAAKAAEEKKAKEAARAEAAAKKKAAAEEKARKEAEKAAAEKAAAEKASLEKAKADEAEAKAKAENLGDTFRRLIRETGPISLAHYMAESNARYYTSRDPLGETGDFITAPEISQMFGELIGLWLADLWVKMGSAERIHLVELGPGRGTLMKDILRTSSRYGFSPQLHFVETSVELRKIQRSEFPQVQFHNDLSSLPEDRPLLIVANEFFDALPIHQLVRSAQGWHERMVGLDDDRMVFVAGDKPMDDVVPPSWKSASQGTMIETSPAATAVMTEIATRLTNQGGAALLIDYGSLELRAGSTLQALKEHKKVDPLNHPGLADLTAHVDFELLGQVAQKNGAEVMGLQMQGEWLRQMGIDTRTEALQRKNPGEADKVQRQRDRLVEDGGMGVLFKVLGICGRRWPIGHGFD